MDTPGFIISPKDILKSRLEVLPGSKPPTFLLVDDTVSLMSQSRHKLALSTKAEQ